MKPTLQEKLYLESRYLEETAPDSGYKAIASHHAHVLGTQITAKQRDLVNKGLAIALELLPFHDQITLLISHNKGERL